MDHSAKISSGTCPSCSKKFASTKLKNRHIKRMHPTETIPHIKFRRTLIVCPLCDERNEVKTYEFLREHLEQNHQVNIEQLTFEFSSKLEFEMWKHTEKIETRYAIHRHRTFREQAYKEVHYACNKNNTQGYESKCYKRKRKSGGTVKMQGFCPSRLIIKIYTDGENVNVNYWKTHAGHDENELRSKHLSTEEKDAIVEKLKAGVPIGRIIEDARKLKTPKLERANLLTRDNVAYLSRKFNIEKKRDQLLEERQLTEQEHQTSSEENIHRFKNFVNVVENLHKEDFDRIMKKHLTNVIDLVMEEVSQLNQRDNQTKTAKKRKMEMRKHFPTKKVKKSKKPE